MLFMEAAVLTDLITSITEIFTGALAWVGQVAAVVTANPIILLSFLIPLIGIGISMLRRLTR